MALGYEQSIRRAVKEHRCYDCGRLIHAGEQYIAYTASPRHDMNDTGKWLHAPFCHGCTESAPEWAEAQQREGAG
jgi:hypothetical protein